LEYTTKTATGATYRKENHTRADEAQLLFATAVKPNPKNYFWNRGAEAAKRIESRANKGRPKKTPQRKRPAKRQATHQASIVTVSAKTIPPPPARARSRRRN
jgi:hypothetical protein